MMIPLWLARKIESDRERQEMDAATLIVATLDRLPTESKERVISSVCARHGIALDPISQEAHVDQTDVDNYADGKGWLGTFRLDRNNRVHPGVESHRRN